MRGREATRAWTEPRPILLAALLAVLLVGTAGTVAAQSDRREAPAAKRAQPWSPELQDTRLGTAGISRQSEPPIVEQEPNNSPATATGVTLGREFVGAIDPAGDVDFFWIQLEGGTTVEIEVFAHRNGSELDSTLQILAPDGATQLAFNDDAVGWDSRLRFTPAANGRYYIVVRDFGGRGGPNFTYLVQTRVLVPAPGDPTSSMATGLGWAWSVVAGPGALYVLSDQRVLNRVNLSGQVSIVASDLRSPSALAMDGMGALLVAENTGVSTEVTRILPDGTRSTFARGLQSVMALTIGPDGDVWIADTAARLIHRFDPFGTVRGTFGLGSSTLFGLVTMAFSPSGDLHIGDYNQTVYRLRNGALEPVLTLPGIGGIAFDQAGNLYAGTFGDGIVLFGPDYRVLHRPFARQDLEMTGSLVFARATTGEMTSRLFAVNAGRGEIRELNSSGVPSPGLRIGIDLLVLTRESVRPAVVGAIYADTLQVQGSPGPLSWSLHSGSLPPGLTLNSSTGVIAGIPESTGTFTFTVRATAGTRIGSGTYTLQVTRPTVDATAAANHLLGQGAPLSEDLLRFLDLQGNRNGRFDIGDLQALLRNQPAGAASASPD
jgi:hypothetical protein